jgi:hypothetical protein
MKRMLALLLLLTTRNQDVADLDVLARGRDVNGLMAHAGPGVKASDLSFLTRQGAFGTGRKGWHAYELVDPAGGQSYVVFGTPITTQDFGEFVFEFADGKLTRLQDERETRGYKVLHYDFSMTFQPDQKRANIVSTVRLRRDVGAKPTAHFRLSPNYKVSSVSDSAGNSLRFAQASGVVSVAPPSGAETTIKMTYSGVVDQPTFAGAIVSDEVMLTNDYWWPSIARGPATVTTTATIPQEWTLVTHGKKVGDVPNGTTRTTRYQMDVPISYLSLSAGKFKHVERKIGRINYHVWSNDMTDADMREQLVLMADVIQFYERIAPYPFDDWGAMVTQLYGGGALEAYSYATYGTGWLPDEDSHEPAHTWFGGLLPNTYMNSYWNESFAVYCGGLFNREMPIGNTAERRRAFVETAQLQRDYRAMPVSEAGAFAGGIASSLGYGKGGLVLQQLEFELGPDKMIVAMQRWIKDHPKGEPAEWDGFEKAVTATAGEEYKWFFDQWVRNATPPDFTINEIGYYGNEVRGRVDFRGVPHRIKTDVYAEMVDGTVAIVDVVLNPLRKDGVSEFSFTLPKKPKLLSFDPYDRILRERLASQALRVQSRLQSLRPIVDAQHRQYADTFGAFANMNNAATAAPSDPAGAFFIGHPDSVPAMRDLCRRAGFTVQGDTLTYDGTKIDLKDGAAVAIIDLGGGKTCAIGLGVTKRTPSVGNAMLALVDGNGRFLRGKTDPRRDGPLVFRVP